jgi:putative ABC transport system ATP-binding protein
MDPERPVAARFVNVSKKYNSGTVRSVALDEVSFEIHQGDFASVMGPSGGGKTTLLNVLGGLDKPDTGEVYVSGKKISELDDNELTRLRREDIGFVFQFFNLMPTMTVRENIDLPLLLNGDSKNGSENAVKLLDYVGLSHRSESFPAELSGGEMQRVAIARSLVHKPALILADEPTGNLDSENGEKILKLMRNISQDFNATFVMVTHNPEAARYGNLKLEIRDGKMTQHY